MISDFKFFTIMRFRQLNFGLTTILRLLQSKNPHFSLVCNFYWCLVKDG